MASWASSNRNGSSTFTTTSSTTDTSFTSSSKLIGIHSPHLILNSKASPVQQYGTAQSQTEEADKENGASGCSRNMASAVLDHFVMFSGLAMATYIGVSSRIGLSVFSEWDGIMHFPSFWAQVVGTLIIGIAVANKDIYVFNLSSHLANNWCLRINDHFLIMECRCKQGPSPAE